jgi:uncharacterized protein
MSANEPEFLRLQHAFAAHLRDPAGTPAPGAHEERRLAIYRHAVYFNAERFLCDNYPRIRRVMPDAAWSTLVRDYLARHVATANAFVDVPREFLAYLEHERDAADDPPFLHELAHFDWLETLVGADERRIDWTTVDPDGDLLTGVPCANPVLVLVNYRFPVHAIDENYLPTEPPEQPTRIAAFRAPDNLYGYLDLNAAAARLLERVIAGAGLSGEALIDIVASELDLPDTPALRTAGGTILARMLERGAILGTLRPD